MRQHILSTALVFCVAVMSGCGSKTPMLGSFVSFETQYVNSEFDGSITLRAWGDGNTRDDAVAQAAKQALHDVLFKGVTKGVASTDYHQRPLVVAPNAEERYQNFFATFFADGGEYTKYVNLKDEKVNSKQVLENKLVYKYGVTVRVLYTQLRQRLQQEGIIPQSN